MISGWNTTPVKGQPCCTPTPPHVPGDGLEQFPRRVRHLARAVGHRGPNELADDRPFVRRNVRRVVDDGGGHNLASRGLAIPDRDSARATLRSIGYYRLSAYLYPLRSWLPKDERGTASPASHRSNDFIEGAEFRHAVDLWHFDRRSRLTLLDAMERVEISLRTSVAYVLGRRDPFGHLRRSSLDGSKCDDRRRPDSHTKFEDWCNRYYKQQEDARPEDFVKHHLFKYGEPIPVWIAVEFLDFGTVVRLYSMLKQDDRHEVAQMHGTKSGRPFGSWLLLLNYLRNVAAHHSRLWNRNLTVTSQTWHPNQAPPTIAHALDTPRDRVYQPLAITAALVRNIDPSSNWHRTLATHIKKFPPVPGQSPESTMGFPEGWTSLPLWNEAPGSR